MRATGRVVLLAAAVALFASHQAAEASEANEAIYSDYQKSIEVARECRKLSFDQAQEQAMGAVIHTKIQGDIGAKRLSLLTAAQREARKLVKKRGCEGAEAQRLLQLYDKDLAPALK